MGCVIIVLQHMLNTYGKIGHIHSKIENGQMAEFQFIVNGELVTYNNYEDIPEDLDFEHVIKFLPDYLEPEGEDGNHTDEQHEEMAKYSAQLDKLMEKERARSN